MQPLRRPANKNEIGTIKSLTNLRNMGLWQLFTTIVSNWDSITASDLVEFLRLEIWVVFPVWDRKSFFSSWQFPFLVLEMAISVLCVSDARDDELLTGCRLIEICLLPISCRFSADRKLEFSWLFPVLESLGTLLWILLFFSVKLNHGWFLPT